MREQADSSPHPAWAHWSQAAAELSLTRETAGLAPVIQCLVRRHADARHPRVVGPQALCESRFLAARDGMCAAVIEVAA